MTEGALLNDRYQLEQKLGSGGMADVFLAKDVFLERNVAIKVLRKDYSNNEEFQKQLLQEAKSAANLSHPNIVTVFDAGIADGLIYIVMEQIPGKDLKQLIRERGRFTVEQGIPIMIQACAGVGYAHRAGLVHCDIKPHNMLISRDMRLKVTDFGIARALESIKHGEKSDVVWGSPLYFSPEQASGESPTPASDVYSLGIVMYELLSGTPPFTASTANELARLHISGRPLPISEYVPDIPSALEEIIMKVLSKEPAARYRTADQLGRVLQKFGTMPDPPIVQQPQPQPASPPVITIRPEIAEKLSPPSQPIPEQITQPDIQPLQTQWQPVSPPVADSEPDNLDWVSVGLGLLAVLAVGGLLPLWLLVFWTFFPPN